MKQPKPAGSWSLAILLTSLVLAGCDQDPDPEAAGEEASVDSASNSIETYKADVETTLEPIGDRLPAEAAKTALIPVTTLFPGTTIVTSELKNPFAGDKQAISRGQRHFTAFNCAGCHAPLGGGGMGPPLSDKQWIYGGEPGQIYLSIMHGRPAGMPAWASMLPEKTAWELVAYIRTLDEIENYAAKKGFDENVDGFRDTDPEG